MVDVISPPKQHTCKCKNCGAGLSYVKMEVQKREYSGYDEKCISHYIICPACTKEVEVSNSWYY